MALKIQQLRYFLLVADTHSYQAAAELCARSQPAVSLAIRDLEAQLGQPLFERGRKAALTPFGRDHYPRIKALVDHHERVSRDLLDHAHRRTGQVALASIPSYAGRTLPTVLAGFANAYPDIEVSVEDGTATHVQQRVLSRRVDFGIATDTGLDVDLVFEHLTEDRMGLVCPADHPLADARAPCSWEALAPYTLITNGTFRQVSDPAARAILDSARFHVPNIVSLLAMVRGGLGVTLLPELALFEAGDDLVFRPMRGERPTRDIGLISLRRETPRPAASALMAAIRAQAEPRRS
ncbi:LysR family transcriptional regulator [Spiribacter salinus]|jgi:DNA-binding transcriptional LysR family regulator|uniref:LysR family transcriptional regulator n=1 Tax=Spiribacter salinus TaxID=1335746 RepID=UPI001C98024D|nr:LysR family transcriptional regulator [Spiribacter salinus]MDR9413996.1 LysR family transcriptional regulator [Spiribacter sp.]